METKDSVQRYFDDELAPEERVRFEAEMTDDDRLRLAALGEMRQLLNQALEADVDVWSGVSKQLTREKAHRGWLRRRVASGAAGLLVAAAATLIFFVHPWHPSHPENDCDVETLEVGNGYATVMQMTDAPHVGDGATTIVWVEDD